MTGTVIAQSGKMQHVLRQVHRLGRYRWPVLLLGETGTGKEVFARALHEVDPIGPFVTIDCSAMVGGLMESELFGHARGAFTGAVAQKTGLIELANGGTAFFDEIGELPLEMQAKLLRVLQEKEYRPVGGTNHRRSEFRVIAATNRDLAREVERGTFRRDLYYRLNVVTLRLPGLRDRMEDIPLLMDHFLDRFGNGHQLTQETKAILVKYPWPGNVRELENCMKHMVSVNSGPYLHNADLPSMIQNHVSGERAHRMAAAAGGDAWQTTMQTSRPVAVEPVPSPSHDSQGIVPLVELERREILRALNFTKGDRVMAASLLGIGRTTLYRKIKEYNVAV